MIHGSKKEKLGVGVGTVVKTQLGRPHALSAFLVSVVSSVSDSVFLLSLIVKDSGSLPPTWGTWVECQAPSLGLALIDIWHVKQQPEDGALSFFLSLSPSSSLLLPSVPCYAHPVSAFQINENTCFWKVEIRKHLRFNDQVNALSVRFCGTQQRYNTWKAL